MYLVCYFVYYEGTSICNMVVSKNYEKWKGENLEKKYNFYFFNSVVIFGKFKN